jgi:hypothetical protein
MPVPVNQITDKQLLEVLSYMEGHFLDLKGGWPGLSFFS